MHGIDCPVVKSSRVLVVGLGLALFMSSGCRTGETWAPKLPKFGSSNLAFGSKPKEEIEPPALSFKPGEANKQPSIGNSTQITTDTSRGSASPRAPYTFQEPNNSPGSASTGLVPAPTSQNALAGNSPSQGLPNLGGASSGVSTSPPASQLGRLPVSPGGDGRVVYNEMEPNRNPGNPVLSDSSLGGLNNSVVDSPLLPRGQNPSAQREIRGIPGGSLGNPLGGNTSNSGTSAPSNNGGLPPAPSRGPATPNNLAPLDSRAPSNGPTSPNGLPPIGQTPSSLPTGLPSAPNSGLSNNALPPAAASSFPSGLGQSLPPANQSQNNTGGSMAPRTPNQSSPLGLTNPAPNHQGGTSGQNTGNSSNTFRPGSVGSPSQPNAMPNYRQTQHGAFPGLPAWPGSSSGSTAPVSAPASRPSQPTGTLQPNGAGLPGLPGALPPVGQRSTSGSSALPSFPGTSPTSGQVVCEGDHCEVR